MTDQDNRPLTMDYLNSWEQNVANAFIEMGLQEPIFGDRAGQTSVRFSNNPSSGQQNTSKQKEK